MDEMDWANWFRHASPYIRAHQDKTMVFAISGYGLQSDELDRVCQDLVLLNTLGVRVIVVYGARPQIDQNLSRAGVSSEFHEGLRLTSIEQLPHILGAYGQLLFELKKRLSAGLKDSPLYNDRTKVLEGNFVIAKPVGVHDGIDYGMTGLPRRIESDSIKQALDDRAIVLIPALGYSNANEIFNLEYAALAGRIASEMSANKLIFMEQDEQTLGAKDFTSQEAMDYAEDLDKDSELQKHLSAAASACFKGVVRAHLVPISSDTALLKELFTRDGAGIMVTSQSDYDEVRNAEVEDVQGILDIIRPLEEQGILVPRDRQHVENDLSHFIVNARDRAVIGCAALFPYPEKSCGELSCFAVNDDYRRLGKGDLLLDVVAERARTLGLSKIFVLTTQTEHWFRDRGFELADWRDLPSEKHYNVRRNAKVLFKSI